MSTTVTIADNFLATEGAKMPTQAQPLAVNPEFGNIRLITPVARASYANLSVPRVVAGSNDQTRRYSVSLMLNPAACVDLYNAMCMIADFRWAKEARPHPQTGQMVEMAGHDLLFIPKEAGGLHYPLRSGDLLYSRDPKKYEVARGLFMLNASLAEKSRGGADQKPVFVNEQAQPENPARFYSGCYVRAQITLGAFPRPGQQIPNRGISVTLNSVQFVSDGPRLMGFDAGGAATAAFAAAGTVGNSGYNPSNDPAFGANTAGPASVPPGTPYGFAAPPGGMPAAPAAPPQAQPSFGGAARPPGV